jgi:hypothetical protein
MEIQEAEGPSRHFDDVGSLGDLEEGRRWSSPVDLEEGRRWSSPVESLPRISVLQRIADLQRNTSTQVSPVATMSVRGRPALETEGRAKINREQCMLSTALTLAMGLMLLFILYIILLA